MSALSSIEWTDRTWNPVRGCSIVSAGCHNCYAMKQAHRFSGEGMPYEGLTKQTPRSGPQWTGAVKTLPWLLLEPLKWKKPQRVFVNSMSDLFHEAVSDEFIDRVFAVMALCPHLTFQVLTKRPDRMRGYFARRDVKDDIHAAQQVLCSTLDDGTVPAKMDPIGERKFVVPRAVWAKAPAFPTGLRWPLQNVWLGVSVEDQATADARIPQLLETPAAVRFVSYEPALGPVDFARHLQGHEDHGIDFERGRAGACVGWTPPLDWVIVGGESGPGARPFDTAWARATVTQCRAVGVPVFVKQIGARPFDSGIDANDVDYTTHCVELLSGRVVPRVRDRKGGDPAEWSDDLRVREFPR